jgi:hypothetical protein
VLFRSVPKQSGESGRERVYVGDPEAIGENTDKIKRNVEYIFVANNQYFT